MGSFEVTLDYRAQRELQELLDQIRRRVYLVFEELAQDPYRPRPRCDIRRLRGERADFAVRVGHYRALYEVAGSVVRVTSIAHRRAANRR